MDVVLVIWVVALTVLVVLGVVWMLDLQRRLRSSRGRSGQTEAGGEGLAAAVTDLTNRLSDTNARTERLVTHVQQIDQTLAHTVQGVGLVRFRAFQDTGGDQSFALALTDGEGNGVVFSALYGRGKTRIYAKPIKGWLSPRPLGEEEEQALQEARKSVVGDN